MSREEKRNNRKRKKKLVTTLFSFLSIYFFISSIPLIFGNTYDTILPEVGTIYKKVDGIGVAIKNESVYYADGSGEIEQLIKEGERVPVGVEIANISQLKDNSRLRQELLEVEQRISALKKTDKEVGKLEDGSEKIEALKADSIIDIQDSINTGSFLDVHKAKENIIVYDIKLKDNSKANTLSGQSLESLNERRTNLLTRINSNKSKYYSKESGIVSFNIDGYENLYIPKEFQNYTYNNINVPSVDKEEKESVITADYPIFKIIDNFEWHMAIKVENKKDIEQYEVGQTLNFDLILDNQDNLLLNGRIVSINTTGNNCVIVVKLNNFLHEIYDIRFVTVNIINFKKEGFKIPNDVIFERNEKKGVYIKEINGIVKFRPIQIVGIEDQYIYIDRGDSNGYILFEGEEKAVRTVTLFDEIFMNPSEVKEGQILK